MTASILTITCAEYNPSFIIPNLANINIVTALIIDDNYLNDFPANTCQFEINLHVLDISLTTETPIKASYDRIQLRLML